MLLRSASRNTGTITLDDILVEDDPVLPILTLRITDKRVITMLHNLRNVRYLEPLDYWPAIAQDDDAVRQLLHFAEPMRDVNNAHAARTQPP